MEKPVLLPERLLISTSMSLLNLPIFSRPFHLIHLAQKTNLKPHIRIRNLRNGREIENKSEQEHETCDSKIHPLNILQGSCIIPYILEERV